MLWCKQNDCDQLHEVQTTSWMLINLILTNNSVDFPLLLTFINNSPRVEGNNVSLDFMTTTPVSSAICFMGRNIVKDCKWQPNCCCYVH